MCVWSANTYKPNANPPRPRTLYAFNSCLGRSTIRSIQLLLLASVEAYTGSWLPLPVHHLWWRMSPCQSANSYLAALPMLRVAPIATTSKDLLGTERSPLGEPCYSSQNASRSYSATQFPGLLEALSTGFLLEARFQFEISQAPSSATYALRVLLSYYIRTAFYQPPILLPVSYSLCRSSGDSCHWATSLTKRNRVRDLPTEVSAKRTAGGEDSSSSSRGPACYFGSHEFPRRPVGLSVAEAWAGTGSESATG